MLLNNAAFGPIVITGVHGKCRSSALLAGDRPSVDRPGAAISAPMFPNKPTAPVFFCIPRCHIEFLFQGASFCTIYFWGWPGFYFLVNIFTPLCNEFDRKNGREYLHLLHSRHQFFWLHRARRNPFIVPRCLHFNREASCQATRCLTCGWQATGFLQFLTPTFFIHQFFIVSYLVRF